MNLLEVHIWDTLVGVLVWDENKQTSRFEYAKTFVKKEWELSPIILPVSSKVVAAQETNEGNSYQIDINKGLPLFLSDSLPDKFGTELFSKYLEKEGRNYRDLSPLEKLAYIGTRGMGAMEFLPTKHNSSGRQLLDLKKLNELSASLITQTPISNLDDMTNLFHVGTSPGGAQPKVLINIDKETGDIYRGDEIPNENQESWILKFNRDIGEQRDKERGKIEYVYYLIAKACGINIMESRLMTVGNEACFMTKRFDRVKGEKIHTQTLHAFAGMNFKLPNAYSYEQIFRLLNQMKFDYQDKEELFRIMVFNVIGQNVDDHTKNFGFNMTADGNWHFSPAYDLTFSYNENYNRVTPHFLSVNGKNENIELADLVEVGNQYSIKKPKRIIQEIQTEFGTWNELGKEVGITKSTIEFVGNKFLKF
ncbi:MAG: type II toxin-antitoxin system HipA family toxin [Flavobacteriales bacterium]